MARVGELTQAADGLAEALLADIEEQANRLWDAQRAIQDKEQWKRLYEYTEFYYRLWDLGTLAAYLAVHSDNTVVQDAARAVGAALRPGGAVIAEGHRGDWFDGIGGVSVYAVPPSVQRISPYYADVALARETRWGEMLKAYHEELL